MMAFSPKGRMRLRSTPRLASNVLPCQTKWLMKLATSVVYVVPGAMMAVPRASPLGISPVGLLVNSASNSACDIFKSCGTSYAMFNPPLPSPRLRRRSSLSQAPRDGIGQDHVGRLFADHVHRTDDEETRDAREDGGVDHAQSSGAVHAEVGPEHAAGLPWPDRTRARGVMAPSVGADVTAELLVARLVRPGQLLLADQAHLAQLVGDRPDQLDAVQDSFQVPL